VSILIQFIFRLSFGLALGMALTNPRQVTSGYYRNHLYVLLGLNVLATMVAISAPSEFSLAPPLAAAILSYVGSLAWLFEKPRVGIAILAAIAALTLWGAWDATAWPASADTPQSILAVLDPPTSGLVLGITIAAMFLGHWYLNSPTMALEPLQRLVILIGAAICLRAAVEAAGVALALNQAPWPSTEGWSFLALRWLSGLVGAFALTVMAWKTLKIPNTQAATGILYVAVIVTFLGELTSLLMAAQGGFSR
jgi:hypothetical protein